MLRIFHGIEVAVASESMICGPVEVAMLSVARGVVVPIPTLPPLGLISVGVKARPDLIL